MPYHATNWPLLAAPWPSELLAMLYADYGVSPASGDAEVIAALSQAGHSADSTCAKQVLERHAVRRYETLTGQPF